MRYDPSGVVAVSTPWNAPFMLATWRVGPALAAGNTVVPKAPEWAPLTCSLLGDLAAQAGVPPGVINIVHGTGTGAGAPLTGHPDVDRVAFTGSPATARTVYVDAATQLTPVSFELGGKSPFVVFEDADLEAAAATAAYQYDNSGQVCLAGTRCSSSARFWTRSWSVCRRGCRRSRWEIVVPSGSSRRGVFRSPHNTRGGTPI